MEKGLIRTNFEGLHCVNRGKVRDVYELGEYLLIVATDRISAFDVIMDDPIPEKGRILTRMSEFWFEKTADIIQNHVVSMVPDDYPEECKPYRKYLEGRSMLVKKAKPLPVECVVRGYLSGSGWQDYRETGIVSGVHLPRGLRESAKLDAPIFTPSTKAEQGVHDMAITRKDVEGIIGSELTDQVEAISLAIYNRAHGIADDAGIIIADTKMEFGIWEGKLILIDEVLTPDSSRFWPKDEYEEGRSQRSFDKQFLRDYLLSINWNKTPPPPRLPEEIIMKTKERYEEALTRIVK